MAAAMLVVDGGMFVPTPFPNKLGAAGVRKGDSTLARTLDTLLVRERPAIRKILGDYGVPLGSAQGGGGPIHGKAITNARRAP